MSTYEMNEEKLSMLQKIENTMMYRKQRAEQYPQDSRNQQSADALAELYSYVEAMPEDHELWEALGGAYLGDGDIDIQIGEAISDYLGRYGFDGKEDHTKFAESIVDVAASKKEKMLASQEISDSGKQDAQQKLAVELVASVKDEIDGLNEQRNTLHEQICALVASRMSADLSNANQRQQIEAEVEEMIEAFDEADNERVNGVPVTDELTALLAKHHQIGEGIMFALDSCNPLINDVRGCAA